MGVQRQGLILPGRAWTALANATAGCTLGEPRERGNHPELLVNPEERNRFPPARAKMMAEGWPEDRESRVRVKPPGAGGRSRLSRREDPAGDAGG